MASQDEVQEVPGRETASSNAIRLLPTEVMVKIAFFIPEWSDLEHFLNAFEPNSDILGPLENLRKLIMLGWRSIDLWPRLNLSKFNAPSRIPLEGIAKYYSKVAVNEKTDVVWVRQFVDPMAAISWTKSHDYRGYIQPNMIQRWKECQITSINFTNIHPNQLEEALSYLDFLHDLQWHRCTPPIATTIFKFMASTLSVRELILETVDRRVENHCVITNSMATDLLKWIESQPIQRFELENFTWESKSLRQQVLTTVLEKPTLERFRLFEGSSATWIFQGFYDRKKDKFTLNFHNPYRNGAHTLNHGDLSDFLSLFRRFLQIKVKKLQVKNLHAMYVQTVLTTLLHESPIEILEVMNGNFTMKVAIQIASVIQDHPTLQELVLGHSRLPSEGASTLLSTVPASVRKVAFVSREYDLFEIYSYREMAELLELARERSIQIWNKYCGDSLQDGNTKIKIPQITLLHLPNSRKSKRQSK
ncbi:hypothetical protein AeMF1_005756 [Aphanomyces euteiches]|nr:hypothetical protein AeMF1_005756 [Aphanomyces euteiches]KAH9183706.1 hypothetical protein AeNC1_014319 [Aphanomyces euteiches]